MGSRHLESAQAFAQQYGIPRCYDSYEALAAGLLRAETIVYGERQIEISGGVDPSHAAGMWWMVEPLAKAAVAVGADGLLIEVHNDPEAAWCDGAQSLKPDRFAKLMGDLRGIANIVGREL